MAVLFAGHVFFDPQGELVHIGGFRFVIDIDPDQQVVGIQRQAVFQCALLEHIVHQKDHDRFAALPLFLQDIAQLGETSPAEDHLGYHFKIAKHVDFLFSGSCIQMLPYLN